MHGTDSGGAISIMYKINRREQLGVYKASRINFLKEHTTLIQEIIEFFTTCFPYENFFYMTDALNVYEYSEA